MSIEKSLLLPHHPYLLLSHQAQIYPLLPSLFQVQGDKVLYQITICSGQNGLAGVVKENLIHFYDRSPITGKVLDYLSYLFGSGYEYRIIDCHRSAISAFHEYIGSRLIYTNQ